MKPVLLFVCAMLAACAGTIPAEQNDVYCGDYAVRINEVSYFDASSAYLDGGIDSAIAYAEQELGPLLVASYETAWTMRSMKTNLMAAARGCNVIIIVERDAVASVERRGDFFYALLAKLRAGDDESLSVQ